jgi:uncharacterized protein (UPF0276 family)
MFTAPPRLGVGWSYFPTSPHVNASIRDLLDFAEVSPEMFCREVYTDQGPRMSVQPALLEAALTELDGLPITVHGLELSIGTAAGWNDAYLTMLDQFATAREFAWHSEHLGYMRCAGPSGELLSAGVPLPLPFTQEAVDLVAPRADLMVQRYERPFLLENAVYYFPDLPADPGWDEIVFLNRLVEHSSCGLLLDLFNLHCNSVNHGFDLIAALGRLRLDRVVEVHVAGGKQHDGFVLDGHCAGVPEPVWAALEWLLPRAPNLAGIVYEVLDQAFSQVGLEVLRRQMERLQSVWLSARSCPT